MPGEKNYCITLFKLLSHISYLSREKWNSNLRPIDLQLTIEVLSNVKYMKKKTNWSPKFFIIASWAGTELNKVGLIIGPANHALQSMREVHPKLQPSHLDFLTESNNLGQHMDTIFVSINLFQLHQFFINCSVDPTILHINVFGPRIIYGILAQLNSTPTIQ